MAAKRKIIAKKKTKARRKKRVVAKPARRRAPGATKKKARKKAKVRARKATGKRAAGYVVAALHRQHGVIYAIGEGWTKSRNGALILPPGGAATLAKSYARAPSLKVIGTFGSRDSAAVIGKTLRSKS